MTLSKFTKPVLMGMVAVGLTGCLEEPEVEIHEPGQYIGVRDPLLDKSGTPEFRQQLANRLNQVQTDR